MMEALKKLFKISAIRSRANHLRNSATVTPEGRLVLRLDQLPRETVKRLSAFATASKAAKAGTLPR